MNTLYAFVLANPYYAAGIMIGIVFFAAAWFTMNRSNASDRRDQAIVYSNSRRSYENGIRKSWWFNYPTE